MRPVTPLQPSETIKQAAYETGVRMAELGHRCAMGGTPAVTLECIDSVMESRLQTLPIGLRLILSKKAFESYMIGYKSATYVKENK